MVAPEQFRSSGTPACHAKVLLLQRDRAPVVVLRHGCIGVLLLRHGRAGEIVFQHDVPECYYAALIVMTE